MAKKVIFFLAPLLFASNLVFGGTIVRLECGKCGFKSQPLHEGMGFLGIENTMFYCDTCKKFYSIPAKIAFQTPENNE